MEGECCQLSTPRITCYAKLNLLPIAVREDNILIVLVCPEGEVGGVGWGLCIGLEI